MLKIRRIMVNFVLMVLIILAFVFLLVKFLEETAVFFPNKGIDLTPAHVGLKFEDLYLKTSDGVKINAWLVKYSDQAATFIFAHGNAGTMSQRVMKVKFLYDLGLNVLMFDYRGYGLSEGKPTENGVYLDAQAAYDYLQSRPDINHERIVGYGVSLGGAVMVDLAVHRKLSALIVESSITSAKEMAQRLYPILPSFMMSIKLDSLSKVKNLTVPKLFMHSPEDRVVPMSMGEKLFQTAASPKEFLMIHGGHNDSVLVNDVKIREGFKKFLQSRSLL